MKYRSFFCMLTLLTCLTQIKADPLNEISKIEPEFIVLIDEQVKTVCNELIGLLRDTQIDFEAARLQEIIAPNTKDIDYEELLFVLHTLINTPTSTGTEKEEQLRQHIGAIHDELLQEYDELVTQLSTRKLRCKYFCKVTTRDLVVNNAAHIAKLKVTGDLTVDSLNGFLFATNGRIGIGTLPANTIADGSVTNAKIADNAITSNKIAPAAITPTETAFNPVVATNGEAKPLTIYRGSVTGATGAITSGSGFTVTRNGAGDYSISLNATAYTDATSYQVFVQLLGESDAVTITYTDGTNFDINTTNDNDFAFFTIGA